MSKHEGAGEAAALPETDLDRPDIGHQMPPTVGKRDLATLKFLELQGFGHRGRQTKRHRTRIDERIHVNRQECRITWIAQYERRSDESHENEFKLRSTVLPIRIWWVNADFQVLRSAPAVVAAVETLAAVWPKRTLRCASSSGRR